MKRNQQLALFFGVLSILCMSFIFYLSAQPGADSAAASDWIAGLLEQLFGAQFTDFVIRKLAHFSEYTALAFCFCGTFYAMRRPKPAWLWALGAASIYAVTDEVHQFFVPGRACQARDWLIDTAGALCGILIFLGLRFAWQQIRKQQLQRKKA